MSSEALVAPEATVTVPRVHVTTAVPWYVWTSVLAVFVGNFGAHWDISWHRSIGRDTFWSPPHIAIYAKGVLAGITFGYLILHTTIAERWRNDVVTIWGLKGPLGAFLAAWGGIAMITSAPFDDWWHKAYGLDTKIISPPHIILIVGGYAITTGALVLVQGLRARATDESQRRGLTAAFLLLGGLALVQITTALMEWTVLPLQHSAAMYRALAVMLPLIVFACGTASRHRWGCTAIAGGYSIFLLALTWVLPFFPAEPKLGPVYHEVTHLVPNGFPLLLIVPAMACDWLLWRMRERPRWMTALAMGIAFIAVLLAVQWPFSAFLQSPMARNWIFGSHYHSYMTAPDSFTATYRFRAESTSLEFWRVMAIAFVAAPISAWFGLGLGRWLERIKR